MSNYLEAKDKNETLKTTIFKNAPDATNSEDIIYQVDDESELLFNADILKYIENLKFKYKLADDIDPYEFLSKIQIELDQELLTVKQKAVLEELKRDLKDEIWANPIELDCDDEQEDSNDSNQLTEEEQRYLWSHNVNHLEDIMEINYKNNLRLALMNDKQYIGKSLKLLVTKDYKAVKFVQKEVH